MAKTKKGNGFVAFIITYSVLLIALIVAGLIYVWNLLIDYEASIPDVNMEKYLVEFEAENIPALMDKYPVEINEYDSMDKVVAAYVNQAERGEISYRKLTGSYTNTTPVYEVMAGDKAIAKVELCENGKNSHGFSVWELKDISFEGYGPNTYDVSIKVPGKATVLINGDVINEAYNVGTEPVALTSNLAEHILDVPEYKIYKIEDLITSLSINVEGDSIVQVTDGEYDIEYTFGTDEDLKQAVSGQVTTMAREYGAYIINKGSLGTLRSYMTGKASEYVSDIPAIWAYLWGEEYSHSYTNEVIDNFVKYSDDCFSCDVSFTLNVTYRGTRSISYDTALSCMYVKKNGRWYLADFALK